MKPRVLAALAACLCIQAAHAAHPLVSDDTGTQGAGNRQFEINTDRTRDGGVSSQSAAATFTHGLRDALDVFMTIPAATTSPSGINDVSIGAKWRFMEGERSSWGLKSELFFPAGDEKRGLGTGRARAGVTLLGAYQVDAWTFLGNIGVTHNRYAIPSDREQNRKVVWRLSAAALYAFDEHWKAVVDAGAAHNEQKAVGTHPAFILLGLIYSPSGKMDVDVGVKVGLNSAEVHRQVGAGLTLRF
ncbi:MAG TPA: transporter [Noviherbaspirillum sp.]|nr:transporter [Noviherbaspirillum sp.]